MVHNIRIRLPRNVFQQNRRQSPIMARQNAPRWNGRIDTMTMTQNEPPAADHRRLAEWELAKLDGDAVARDVAFAVVQSSPGGAVAGFETAATCHLNLMIAVAGEDGARRTLQAAALDASLTRIPPMTDPVAGDQAPEPEPAEAPDPEPAAADTSKRHWDESLWHRSPTPRYRP